MTQLERGQIDLLLLLIGEKWSREAEDDLRAHIAALEAEIERLKNAPCIHDQAFLKSTNPNY